MARRDETPRDLLFGLLALQNGLIDQEQLIGAFSAWSRAKGKALAEILVERAAIDEESRALLASMAEKQLKLHGGDTEKSLAAVMAGPSTREKLAALGDPDLTASVSLMGSNTPAPDASATMSISATTSEGQRFRGSCGPMRKADWVAGVRGPRRREPESARWPSSRSSTSTPTILKTGPGS